MMELSEDLAKLKLEPGRKNDGLCVQSKRIILNEQTDRLTNLYLSDDPIVLNKEKPVVKPKNDEKNNLIRCIVQESLSKAIESQKYQHDQKYVKELLITSRSTKLSKKYFDIWKWKVKKKNRPNTALIKKEKIEKFVAKLKMCKEKPEPKKPDRKLNCYLPKPPQNEHFEYRLKAQKNVIETQKEQIEEQKKIIDNLRLGIIQDETKKSLSDSRNEIKEIFRRCSGRVRCKITPPQAVENDVHVIELRCGKPPKILAEMEKRAEERSIKRRIVLERKKVSDEKKKRELAEAIDKKKAADEEERKRNLEAINERRRNEAAELKLRDLRRKGYLESIRKADKFYRKKMKRKIFSGFKSLIEIRNENLFKSEIFYEKLIQKQSFLQWKRHTTKEINIRNHKADGLLKMKITQKYFKLWKKLLLMQKQSVQVADDIYDMKLQSKMFINWRRYYDWEQMVLYKKGENAKKHYDRKILVQYFYLWKSLPAVLKLEKAKEEKKRKWREKVWEIIPDYKPYGEESIVVL